MGKDEKGEEELVDMCGCGGVDCAEGCWDLGSNAEGGSWLVCKGC